MKKIIIASLLLLGIYSIYFAKSPIDQELSTKLKQSSQYVKLGACGFEALYIKKYLDKRQIPSHIVIFGDVPHHVMVVADGVYIDKHGYWNRTFYPLTFIYPQHVLTVDSLQKMLNNPAIWNKKFNRADTSKIKEIFEL